MKLYLDDSVLLSKWVDIEDSPRGTSLHIGKGSRVDSFVKFKPVGGVGDIEIGENVYINSGCVFYSGNGVKVGNNVLIGPNCTFAPVNHEFVSRDRLISEQRFKPSKGGIVIEDDVWLGAGVIILDGTHIKRGAVVGAGSIVKGLLDEYSINVGNPSRTIGFRT